MKPMHLEDVTLIFYLAVNKLITDKLQIAEHSIFIKYNLNKLN